MEITNRIGQRALTYVAAVTSQGYELTAEEFERYIGMPMPAVDAAMAATRAGSGGGEPVLDWLVRLGWLARSGGAVTITPLGRAVLRAVEQHELATELPPEVILGPGEPFTYGPVLGRIGDLGDALLVDRTFQFDQLLDVMLRTSVTRILVGADAQYEQDRRRLAAAMSRPLGLDRQLRIAVSAELHDRFVVPAGGPVGFLAATRNVLGHRHAIFGLVQAPAADDIRAQLEELWSRATPLAAEPQLGASATRGPGAGGDEAIDRSRPAALDAPAGADPDTVPAAPSTPPAQPPRAEPAVPPLLQAAPPAPAVQLPDLPPLRPNTDLDEGPGTNPWVPRPQVPGQPPAPSPVTALRSLVSPLEGAALSGSQRPGADEDPTRPAPPLPPPPLLRPVPGSRPLHEPLLRPVGDPPQRFSEPPQPGELPYTPGGFGQGPEPDQGQRPPVPPWAPPSPWTPPSTRGPSPFQRHDLPADGDDEGPSTQAWSADDRDG